MRRPGRHLGHSRESELTDNHVSISNTTIFGTMATFMFGAIISGEVGIAEQSGTGGKIGIVEGAA
ncbi:hypothetical protein [Bradyrhizobium sp.]|jgi:hypothetical protein|uniref:hypothetical protein n=1 Tax=Bradyrhizobium sp. TaxID=376 RepID=UPI002CFAA492|nr:hypothetical protein [Bradyrhizobium sp.]HWX60209.1 hypothetical protein [Bradyrhizobium sp.]